MKIVHRVHMLNRVRDCVRRVQEDITNHFRDSHRAWRAKMGFQTEKG